MKLFTTGEVAKILNLPGSRIALSCAPAFLRRRGTKKSFQFTFQDLLFLKTAKGLSTLACQQRESSACFLR